MADKKIVAPAEDSQMAKLNSAMIDYALALIEETKRSTQTKNTKLPKKLFRFTR